METPLRVSIEFDGVVHDPTNKRPGYKMGLPIPGAPTALKDLHDSGAIIVIHSIWATTEKRQKAIREWCTFFGIPFDFVTNTATKCDYFINSKAVRFTDWIHTMEFLRGDRPRKPEASAGDYI